MDLVELGCHCDGMAAHVTEAGPAGAESGSTRGARLMTASRMCVWVVVDAGH
jgi:hypothetical protein